MLQETANRLSNGLRQSDTAARLGGDEFALLLPTVKDTSSAIVTLDKILKLFKHPMLIDNQSVSISPSLGLALFPQDGNNALTLMRRADLAMYEAKQRKSGYVIYTANLEKEVVERLG